MSWDNATLIILASFGCATLLLTQIAEVLSKLPAIIRAWHEVRRALQAGLDHPPGEETPQEIDEMSPMTGGGNSPEERHSA
ncbi:MULTISPECIES: hypothetical protein [unclassified Streptomyces]|uniref:hypothetical protein n=1 Tax=unclassified Streptomyces TaxID=2593676 RepID=UPI002DDB1FB1|nr:hypothetical protein [Streptomyces sp. NBC_01750]WSB01445.1 hypothetical protein OIE54_20335 [Streptomyces sp. NBC_01794]WSD34226.1 hypothetical protein OG966_21435 [Streptomyces sp. NBC_01750]